MFQFETPHRPRVQPLNATEAVARAARGEITLVDVRDINELRASGKAEGAVHAPMMLLNFRADPRHPDHDPAFDPQKPVAVYCAAGGRAEMAGQMLLNLGYDQVFNIGGLGNWRAAGGPVAPVA